MINSSPAPHGHSATGMNAEGDLLAGLTELEERFNGPNGAAEKAEALARLSRCRESLEELRAQRLPLDVFTASEKLVAALDAAIFVILNPRKDQ